ncbi:hypothetical protein SAMN06297144_3184 [Sphingomonas guangdongensis]|jgi:hypothetical protein|uniref:Uncharacterized protein n=1 Tax=Sphingomonas guangdongensis TaxID=1141890 RepID=A0A285R1Q7_9SPHN|nr:hypothetical protein [Sphingomonas guangdongensis]GLK22631.1 hypothetical protein GCM10017606_34590 [Microbacterium terregens]SOB88046.1 hypothetical protein SAMN06297144_3184 [Sphingomonas guangdongensis]
MPMTEDQERWAEALAIEQLHGERAKAWVAERIAVFREAGDSKGVERFSILAACLDQLQFGPARGQ